jgi:hypothetical protein
MLVLILASFIIPVIITCVVLGSVLSESAALKLTHFSGIIGRLSPIFTYDDWDFSPLFTIHQVYLVVERCSCNKDMHRQPHIHTALLSA